ncbi:hypothetical protein [Catenovulum sp. 2E275]|uniref:hypothetical protein n=1 Tax=Catenovulum sp. 2E275 TaxID=2980497 RepID=UPI0021D184B4|nr:hypothetical protein [Catenovulum sp. 2E275]
MSIQSLVRNVSLIADIYVFIDQKAPLTKEQENSLIQIYPNIKFYPVENFAWASIETTMTEVNSFLKVANESEPENYLVKVDSDILFLKGSKLARISISGLDTIGDYRHTEGQYYQGGLYFIKHKVIKQCFNHATADDFKQIAKQWKGNFAEDLAISQRLIDQGIKTNSTRLMLFPNEYQNLKHANKMVRWEFAALHFVKDKQNMQHYFDSFIN